MSSVETAQDVITGTADGCCEVFVVDAERVERARAALPAEHLVSVAAALFKVIGHPTRVRILLALAAEELCVCDLADLFEQRSSSESGADDAHAAGSLLSRQRSHHSAWKVA